MPTPAAMKSPRPLVVVDISPLFSSSVDGQVAAEVKCVPCDVVFKNRPVALVVLVDLDRTAGGNVSRTVHMNRALILCFCTAKSCWREGKQDDSPFQRQRTKEAYPDETGGVQTAWQADTPGRDYPGSWLKTDILITQHAAEV